MSALKINTAVPVELTTTQGYNDFVRSPLNREQSTVFPDNDQTGYVLVNDEVVATVSGEAREHLFAYTQESPYDSPLSSPVRN